MESILPSVEETFHLLRFRTASNQEQPGDKRMDTALFCQALRLCFIDLLYDPTRLGCKHPLLPSLFVCSKLRAAAWPAFPRSGWPLPSAQEHTNVRSSAITLADLRRPGHNRRYMGKTGHMD